MVHPRWCHEGSAYEIGYLDHGWALIKALVPGGRVIPTGELVQAGDSRGCSMCL